MRAWFSALARRVSTASGSPYAFALALALVLGWAASGPLFGFSDAWELIINTTTTIVTFLLVFLIQHAQNRDTAAVQLKLDELLRAMSEARTEFAGAEEWEEGDLAAMRAAILEEGADGR